MVWLGWQTISICTIPLMGEPRILDVDRTIKPLYGHQEGAGLGSNPHKPGRPSHWYHTYQLSQPAPNPAGRYGTDNQHKVKHATRGLWDLLDHLGPERRPVLLRGDNTRGTESVMIEAEQRKLDYLFRLRLTKNVQRAMERSMREFDWPDAGQGWQGKETHLRLHGWGRQHNPPLLLNPE